MAREPEHHHRRHHRHHARHKADAPAVTHAETASYDAAAPATSFSSVGTLPAAVDTAAAGAGPTASEQAFGPATKQGPGVQALQSLLAKLPTPKQVVDLIDAHRDEHDAMFAYLDGAAGAPFVAQVKDQMGKLRASISRKEVVAGDVNDPNSGYFIGSQAEGGARWKTADGGFTGTANKDGLDSKVALNKHDALHANVVAADKSGTLAWERDGKNEGELYGKYNSGKDYEAGVRKNWALDSGALTTGARHKVDGAGTTDELYGSYKSTDGKTTADGALGLRGGALVGSGNVTAHPTDHDTLKASVARDEKGTTFNATDTHTFDHGSLTGTVAHDAKGTTLSATGDHTFDNGNKVNGSLVHGPDGTTTLSGDGTFGKDKVSASASHGANGTSIKASDTHTFDHGSLTGSVAHDNKGTTVSANGQGEIGNDKFSGAIAHGPDGTTWNATDTHKFEHGSLTGSVAHDNKGTTVSASGNGEIGKDKFSGAFSTGPAGTTWNATDTHTFDHGSLTGTVAHDNKGTTGSIAGTYDEGGKHLAGNITRATDSTSLHLEGSDKISPNWTVNGHADYTKPDHGKGQATIGLSERYRSGNMIHGLDLDAGKGERDYLKATGSMDAQLGKNLYGGAWGSYAMESGHQSTGQLGASLTFTPSEKTALTLAGVLDQSGAIEARLQFDVFKSKIASVGDLSDHKKDALVSLFVSYTQGGNKHMLDDRFGAPQQSFGSSSGQVNAGIRIKF